MSNEVTRASIDQIIFSEDSPALMKRCIAWAEYMVTSGLLPKHINSPQKAVMTMLKARELGISPLAGMSSIYLVNGNVSLSASLMEAVLRQGGVDIVVGKWDATICQLTFKRKGFSDFPAEFTIQEAKTAGLTSKDPWKFYTRQMLYNRALSIGAKRIGADLIHGCYVEGEIEDAEVVREVKPEAPRAIQSSKMDRMAAQFMEAEPEPVPVEAERDPVPERNASLFPDDDDDVPDWDGPVETNRAN